MRPFASLASLSLAASVYAQSNNSLSLSLTTGSVTVAISTTIANRPTQLVTVLPAVFNVTHTLTQSASSTTTTTAANATSTPSATPTPVTLATKVDPAFGVLGAILILTGLPSAFWGHKNRTSFFLIGFYTLALVCTVLILKFGVLPSINPPSKTLRGMFVLSSSIAGIAGGAVAIFFWKAARYGIGAWGGFALGLWIQCFHNGGVIRPIGFRWILYIGCGVAGFALCTIPKIHYHILLISTAFVGATSFMLGVDCFTTAGLKEFYIWNLGFPALFPKFVNNGIQFPVSQTMQIELGLIGAVALMGIAVQFRILKVLQKKLHEISEEQRNRDEEAEVQASERFHEIKQEQENWEKDHPTLTKHGRQESSLSSMPLMKDREGSSTPTTADRLSSYMPQEEGRARALSGVSDFKVAPPSDEELRRASRHMQNPGVLPTLDLGLGIQEDVPANFIANERHRPNVQLEEIKRKEELLAEIQNIRKSIDILKSETPVPSSTDQSRRPSLASRRTLSIDANHALIPITSRSRPPRATDPRARVHSMEFSAMARHSPTGDPISRPTSVPLNDTDWETYIQERKLLQPPVGITAPIPTTPLMASSSSRVPMPPAVQDALNKRKKRESVLFSEPSTESSAEDVPLAKFTREKKGSAGGNIAPISILPPRRPSGHIAAPVAQIPAATRTRTFEELNERHREKMRDMQAPLTKAEKESAEVEAARKRWERSRALEKEAVTRRQAEKAAALEKKRQPDNGSDAEKFKGRSSYDHGHPNRHSRSMSGDKLGQDGTPAKRLSTLKVADWQRYQQDAEATTAEQTQAATTLSPRRESRTGQQGVPFPDSSKGGKQRRKNMGRDLLG